MNNTSVVCNSTAGSRSSYIGLVVTLMVTTPGLTANALALCCLVPDWKKNRTLVKDLLLALCTADIFGCLGVLIHHSTLRFNDVPDSVCAVTTFLTTYLPLLSGIIATAMAGERCVALRAPYWYQENMFRGKMWAPFITVVLIGTIICLFPEVGLGHFVKFKTKGCLVVKVCGALPESKVMKVKESLFSISYAGIGLLLVAINVSFNMAVVRTLYEMTRRVNPSVRSSNDPSQEFEMTKMLLVLSFTFLICWVPMNLHTIFVQIGFKKSSALTSLFMTLIGINFAADPFIYLFMKRSYREKVWRMMRCKDNIAGECSDTSGSQPPVSRDRNEIPKTLREFISK